jgi:hypothetical protein
MPVCKRILTSRVFWFAAVVVVVAAVFFFAYVAQYGPDPQETIVLGQSSLFADSTAAFRVVVRDHVKSAPIAGAKVRMVITGQGGREEIGVFTTDADGSLSDSVHVPSLTPGQYELTVESVSAVGKDRIVQPLWIERTSRVYVTTDKPVYQPGQTIHMRALVLDKVTLRPAAAQPILFEVTEAKGNKVFNADLTTSPYGLASCDFTLGDEVNLGDYHIRVANGKVGSDRVVRVQRYVLPRFKIALTTDKPFYLRSEKVQGEVRADYFFGKPVANAEVTATGRTLDAGAEEIFKVTGTTDPNGTFRFDAACSERPVNERSDDSAESTPRRRETARKENIPFEIEVTAKDRTGHEETAVERRTLAGQGINIHVFPEGGNFLKGIENIIYVLTAYPTGDPAVCTVEVNGVTLQSDSMGVTVFKTRLDADRRTLDIKARDAAGRTGDWTDEIVAWGLSNDMCFRTDKAVYCLGEKPLVTILPPGHRATFFLDVLHNGQTVLTRTLPANDQGQTQMALDLPGDLWGVLELKAYAVTAGARIDMETRVIYVRGADELRIETSLDKAVFRPGETAQARFQVADSSGRPVPAALSLAAVDEAVFYVCENQPGRLDQFFLADGKLPLFGYQMAFAISPAKLLSGEEQYQNLARALFSVYGQATGRNREDENRRESADRQVYETYRGIDRHGYTLRAESRSQKRAEAAAFRHRYLHVPLVSMAVLAVLMVVLGALIVLARSLFRLFRQMAAEECDDGQRLTAGAVERRVQALAFAVLLPLVTYIEAVVITQLLDSYRADDRFSINPRLLGVLVVVLSALATLGFPLVYRFGTTPFRRLGKAAFKVLSLPLLCIGLVYEVTYVAAKAIISV